MCVVVFFGNSKKDGNLITRLMIAAFLGLASLGITPARAGIVFDSITGASLIGHNPIASSGPVGDSFMSGSGITTLADVKFVLSQNAGSPTGSVTATLYASSSNSPSIPLATIGTVNTSAVPFNA